MSWSEAEVFEVISKELYVDAINTIDSLPQPGEVRDVLDSKLGICKNRSRRVTLVERVNEYKVLITIPSGKSECDFKVWRYFPGSTPLLKIPTHDDLGKMFIELKRKHRLIDEFLINATIKLLETDGGLTA